MITGIILFVIANSAITAFFNGVYSHTEDIYAILAVVIFLTIALTFVREARRYAWIGFIIAVILYAAVGFLAPYIVTLTFVISIIVAILATVAIKRPLWRAMRREDQLVQSRIPGWGRLLIRFI